MPNKIAVISDIHGNLLALEAVLEDIEKLNIEKVLNLGDILHGPLDPEGTFQLLSEENFITISGNQDRIILENWDKKNDTNTTLRFVLDSLPDSAFDWLKKLKAYKAWKNVFMCHGNLERDDAPLIETFRNGKVLQKSAADLENDVQAIEEKILLCGHTHVPKIVELPDSGKFILNPGSVGLPAYDDDRPFYHKMESDSPLAKYLVIEFDGPNVTSFNQRHIKYDHGQAAKQAEMNGRADWAH